MDNFYNRWQDYRSKKLAFLAELLLKLKISANIMTFFSLLFGVLAVYFLFQNYYLFLLFTFLHLFADSLDGVLARKTKVTKFGEYSDYFVDRLMELLLLLKIAYAYYLQDYFPLLVLAFFLFTQTVYLFSRFQAPITFARTLMFIVLLFSPINLFLFSTLAYLLAGIFYLFAFSQQIGGFVKKRF